MGAGGNGENEMGRGAMGRVRWGGGQQGRRNRDGETGRVEVLARAGSGEGEKWRVRLGCNGEEEGGNGKGEMGRGQQEGGDGEGHKGKG